MTSLIPFDVRNPQMPFPIFFCSLVRDRALTTGGPGNGLTGEFAPPPS